MRSKSSSCKFILLGEWRRQKRCTPGTEQRVSNSIRVLIPFRQIWPFAETGIADGVYAINTCFVSLYPDKYEQLNHQHPRPLQLRALSTAFRDLWPVLTSELQCLRTVLVLKVTWSTALNASRNAHRKALWVRNAVVWETKACVERLHVLWRPSPSTSA